MLLANHLHRHKPRAYKSHLRKHKAPRSKEESQTAPAPTRTKTVNVIWRSRATQTTFNIARLPLMERQLTHGLKQANESDDHVKQTTPGNEAPNPKRQKRRGAAEVTTESWTNMYTHTKPRRENIYAGTEEAPQHDAPLPAGQGRIHTMNGQKTTVPEDYSTRVGCLRLQWECDRMHT